MYALKPADLTLNLRMLLTQQIAQTMSGGNLPAGFLRGLALYGEAPPAELSGMVATITVVASIGLSAFGSESIGTLFVQVLGVAILTALLAYLLMFPTFLILRYKYPAIPRKYRVPGGLVGAWIVTLLPMAYVGIACYFLLIPSDVYLQNNYLDRLTFELTHFVPLACIIVLTIVLYIWGQRGKQNRDVLVDLGGSLDTEC